MVETPDRLWLPLLILETAGPIYTKTKLQKLAFLVQYLSKLDVYDFKKHHYGPYSDTLELDTVCYHKLIEREVHDSVYSNRQYYAYKITNDGGLLLADAKKKIDPKLLEKIRQNIVLYKDKNHCELLEKVYSEFALKSQDSLNLLNEVRTELLVVQPPLIHCYETHNNRQSIFVLSALELVEKTLLAIEGVDDTVQRGVVLNLSKEIIQKCKDLTKDIIPPVNSDSIKPRFIEIAELDGYLREYCDTRNILRDSFKQPIEEILTEDEAERLAKVLSEITVPV